MASKRGLTKTAWRRVSMKFCVGMMVAVVLVGAEFFFEQTDTGREFEMFLHVLLLKRLAPSYEEAPPNAVVIDIGTLDQKEKILFDGTPQKLTDREALKSIILELLDHSRSAPSAIGIDVDFSARNLQTRRGDFLIKEDEEFFHFCHEQSQKSGVPIFLGVWRALTMPPDSWLAESQYRDLACSISVPREDKIVDKDWPKGMILDTRWGYVWQSRTDADANDRLLSMGQRLAEAQYGRKVNKKAGLSRWFFEGEREIQINSETKAAIGVVDYGFLHALNPKRESQFPTKENLLSYGNLHDKMVLLGPITRIDASDTFNVPGEPWPVPGVFVHACTALTYAGGYLLVLTEKGRLTLDLVLASIVIAAVAYVCARMERETQHGRLNPHFIDRLMTYTAVAFVTLAASTPGFRWGA